MVDERRTMRISVLVDGTETAEARLQRLQRVVAETIRAQSQHIEANLAGGNIPGIDAIATGALRSAQPGPTNKVAEAAAKVASAELRLASVLDRESKDEELSAAQVRALAKQRLDAALAVVAAQRNLATAIEAETRTHENLVSAGRARDAQVALMSDKLDEERRLREMRANATYAFSQIPIAGSENALTQQEINRLLNTPARQPGDTDRTFQQRQVLADRQLQAQAAELRLRDAVNKALSGEAGTREQASAKVLSAQSSYDAAMRAVVTAEQKLATSLNDTAAIGAAGRAQSLRESFVVGFRGQREAPFAEQFGQAAKFSLFYGGAYKALFLLTQTLQNTLTEGIAFQDAMTDLHIAAGRPKEELDGLAGELSRIAVETGAAPSQGIQVGARALGLYGVTQGSAAEQDRVARISAEVVSKLAVGSGKTPTDLQGDIAAIAQALQLGPEGQFRIADLDAFFTKRFGIQQGSTLRTVGESATVGIAAGFTPDELFALAANLQSRTGQTDTAVAGYLAQIFSRGGEGTLTSVAQRYGIDPTQELATVVRQLAAVYKDAGPQERANIAAAFGRGKVQNAAIAMLADFEEIQRSVAESKDAASGSADAQFQERMNNIGGVLAQFGGNLKDFAGLLGETGLLDIFGLLIISTNELVEAVNGVLKLFNEIPRPIRDVIVGLGLLAVSLKAAGVVGLGGRAVGAFAEARGASMLASQYAAGAAGASTVARGSGVLAAGRGSLAFAGALLTPATLAVGGLLALGALKGAADKMRDAMDASSASLLQYDKAIDMSADQARARAAEATNLATENRGATPGWLNVLSFGLANNSNIAAAERQDATAKFFERLASDTEAAAARVPVKIDEVFAQGLDKVGIEAGMASLQASGATATQQFEALAAAINNAGTAGASAAASYDRNVFAGQLAADVPGRAFDAASFVGLTDPNRPANAGTTIPTVNDYKTVFEQAMNLERIQAELDAALAASGASSPLELNPAKRDEIANTVAGTLAEDFISRLPEMYRNDTNVAAVTEAIRSALNDQLDLGVSEWKARFRGPDGKLPADAAVAFMQESIRTTNDIVGSLGDLSFGGKKRQLNSLLNQLTNTVPKKYESNDFSEGMRLEAIKSVREQLVQVEIDRLEALRQVALRNAGSRREAVKSSRGFIRRMIGQVVNRGGSADQLAGVLEMAGKGAISIAQKAISDAVAVAQAALSVEKLIQQSLGNLLDATSGIIGAAALGAAGSINPEAQAELDRLLALQESLGYIKSGTTEGEISTYSGSPQGQKAGGGGGTPADSPAAIAAARARAHAAAVGGDLAAARAAVASARAAMADAKKGTVEYYEALASLHDARRQLNDALLAYRNNLRLLRIDMSNPLAMARAEAAAAAAKLRADIRRGQARDVIAADRVELRQARLNEEATRFQQRLEAVQTAEELGRISHTKYMAYLDRERERLSRIKKRTYQQQQQLNEIDRLIKEANESMSGQFNFGDIKLPTPYQVRRYIEQTNYGSTGGALVATSAARAVPTNNVVMHVNGADVQKVKQIVRDVVGANGRITTTASKRR